MNKLIIIVCFFAQGT